MPSSIIIVLGWVAEPRIWKNDQQYVPTDSKIHQRWKEASGLQWWLIYPIKYFRKSINNNRKMNIYEIRQYIQAYINKYKLRHVYNILSILVYKPFARWCTIIKHIRRGATYPESTSSTMFLTFQSRI